MTTIRSTEDRTTIVDRTKDANHEANSMGRFDAEDRLRENGWHYLGQGCFGSVWAHPDCPDTVLKVGRYSMGDPKRDGWLNYAMSCRRTKSRHAPRIEAIEMYENFYYAEIERLEELPRDLYNANGICRHGGTDDLKSPSLKVFTRRCERIREHLAFDPDYHAGNYMCRPSTGEIVLTDPWC